MRLTFREMKSLFLRLAVTRFGIVRIICMIAACMYHFLGINNPPQRQQSLPYIVLLETPQQIDTSFGEFELVVFAFL